MPRQSVSRFCNFCPCSPQVVRTFTNNDPVAYTKFRQETLFAQRTRHYDRFDRLMQKDFRFQTICAEYEFPLRRFYRKCPSLWTKRRHWTQFQHQQCAALQFVMNPTITKSAMCKVHTKSNITISQHWDNYTDSLASFTSDSSATFTSSKAAVTEKSRFLCTLMMLTNLAEPEWLHVPCDQDLVEDTLCLVEGNSQQNISQQEVTNYPTHCVLKNSTCFLFFWNDIGLRKEKQKRMNLVTFVARNAFVYLFDAVNVIFPPIFTNHFTSVITYNRFAEIYMFFKKPAGDKVRGLFLMSHDTTQFRDRSLKNTNIFECQSGTLISLVFLCDGQRDCPEKSPPLWVRDNEGGKASDWSRIQNPAF